MTYPSHSLMRNIVALYGRGMFVLACGVFSSRWVLSALGKEGYGLYVLLCGVVAVVLFANDVAGRATERYLALAAGGGKDVRGWFNAALSMHVVLTIAVAAIGYPLAMLAVKRFLSIPEAFMPDMLAMLRYLFIAALVQVATTPWRMAMTAYGRIGELALWGCICPTANILAAAWMVTHEGNWMVFYQQALTLGVVLADVVVCMRAHALFPECRVVWTEMKGCLARLCKMARFAFWRFGCDMGAMVGTHGLTFMVNKLFGPSWNASLGISRTVVNHADGLALSFGDVFGPRLANTAGTDDAGGLVSQTEKFAFLTVSAFLLLAVPLAAGLEDIFAFWLNGQVPPGAVACTWWLMGSLAAGEAARSYFDAVTANGKIPRLYLACGLLQAGTLLAAWLMWYAGLGFERMFAGVFVMQAIRAVVTVVMAERRVGVSWRRWFSRIVLPLGAVTLLALAAGRFVRGAMPDVHLALRALAAIIPAGLVYVVGCWWAGRGFLWGRRANYDVKGES